MDYDENQNAPLSRVIWKDHHISWDPTTMEEIL